MARIGWNIANEKEELALVIKELTSKVVVLQTWSFVVKYLN